MRILIIMCLTSTLIFFARPISAQDASEGIEIDSKCMKIAQNYAEEEGGPWSHDAKFGYVNNHICTIIVSQIGYNGQLCHPTYSISLKTWKVTQVNYAGCIDQN